MQVSFKKRTSAGLPKGKSSAKNLTELMPGEEGVLEKLDLRWISTLKFPRWIDDLEARGCAVYR